MENYFVHLWCVCVFKPRSHSAAQVDLKLEVILLPQSPQYYDYKLELWGRHD